MTRLEKLLACMIGAMVYLIILYFGYRSYNSQYTLANSRLIAMDRQINDENLRTMDAFAAGDRRNYFYKSASFATGQNDLTEYQDWLEKLIRDCGLKYRSIAKPKKNTFKFRAEGMGVFDIGDRIVLNFDTTGTLDQILKFVYEFEQLDVLHKIRDVTLQPMVDKNNIGNVKAAFKVELLALADADETRDFKSNSRELEKSLDDYEKVVIARNIFGPANNPPRLRLSKRTFTEGKDISVSLSGSDKDKNDTLAYEIVDAGGIEGAEITSKKSGRSEKFSFTSPPLEVGEYKAIIRVTDSGYPPKFMDEELDIVIKAKKVEKKEEKVVEVEEPDPPYKHVADTQINSITSIDGVVQAKIRVRTQGKIFLVKKGDEFELDEAIWKLREIDMRGLTLESDGKLMKYRLGDFLDQPRNEEVIAAEDEEMKVSSAASVGSR
ncbi:MAG: hypothetical protein AAGA30_06915 [Planctomycetota bacterium]